MKCWICHKEMENMSGGCYYCEDCRLWVTEDNNTTEEIINKLTKLQNQKAIECLKKIRQDVLVDNCEDYSVDLNYLLELIDNKIKELEEEND